MSTSMIVYFYRNGGDPVYSKEYTIYKNIVEVSLDVEDYDEVRIIFYPDNVSTQSEESICLLENPLHSEE